MQHGNSFSMNPDAFSVIDFKFDADKLIAAYKRIDLNLSWSAIGKAKSIQDYFGVKKQMSAGEKAKELFERIYNIRCDFAHTGAESRSLSTEENIYDLVKFLRILSASIFEQLKAHTVKLISSTCA
jgi:hypothetical protein